MSHSAQDVNDAQADELESRRLGETIAATSGNDEEEFSTDEGITDSESGSDEDEEEDAAAMLPIDHTGNSSDSEGEDESGTVEDDLQSTVTSKQDSSDIPVARQLGPAAVQSKSPIDETMGTATDEEADNHEEHEGSQTEESEEEEDDEDDEDEEEEEP
jgi:hypothetical protein